MNFTKHILIIFFLSTFVSKAQNDIIKINANLNYQKREIQVQQEIKYYNNTRTILDTLYFHNWANSYKNNRTPLSKRLIEDYDKSLYFAKAEKRGSSIIKNISNNYVSTKWDIDKNAPDIISVILNEPLQPNDSATVSFTYIIKVPEDIFTGYGRNSTTYNLRFWYITPVVFDTQWQLMSNLNMDDLYMSPTDYAIDFTLPKGIHFNTDLELTKSNDSINTTYHLKGKNRTDIELNINVLNDFVHFNTNPVKVITNLNGTLLDKQVKTDIINRELAFIENHLGAYPHEKLLINRITYDKNPIYGLNQLPKFLNPFSGVFEWDIKMFKALTRRYLENTIITNRRNDAWIVDGIQTYLMIKYVEKYYPEVKAMGKISKIWGVKSYQLARLNFNEKYTFVNQFAMRKSLDQALTTRADSLSTFNRKIVNKYKAGIGLIYLDEYLENDVISKSLKQFYHDNYLKKTTSKQFEKILKSKTEKDINWFVNDYLHTSKKLDYIIKKVKKTNDSIKIIIKNKRNFTAPITLYGLKNKKIQFKKWLTGIDSTKTITIPKGDFTRLSLNYENSYPELNSNNNWKNLNPSLLNRPVLLRFLKDIDNPYYNQIFYNLESDYNFYDGLLLGISLSNKTLFKKRWNYNITPTYGTTSRKLTGYFSFVFQHLPENTSIHKFTSGISGNLFHYAPDLSYRSLTPFIGIEFNRKSLRDVGGKSLFARYVSIDKEIEIDAAPSESDNYGVFNIRYAYSKPDIIKDLRYFFDFQLGDKFSKVAVDFRYRKLTDKHRQYDFRAYFGTFLHNKTEDTFFSFSLDRPSDYLFDYRFLGRSEQSGFFSQQIIIAEGGFKSQFEDRFANQWMFTTNGSVSVWRWIEIYADAGFYKSKNEASLFKYDSGIRLNFIHNILELYLPVQSSLGFELTQPQYSSKIRFVITLNPKRIYNFVKRGFY